VSARLRLTLLYTVLFAAAGAALLAIVYGLVARSLNHNRGGSAVDKQLLSQCTGAFIKPQSLNPGLTDKCREVLAAAASLGATSQRDATLRHLLQYSIAGLALTTLLAAALGWIVAGRILRPVHAITAAARRASEQHLGERLALTGPRDELRELADTFDEMLDRLDAAFDGQRRFVANASHELRTPLTVMRTAVDVTLSKPEPTPEELRHMGTSVRGAVEDAERLIEALLTLAKSEQNARTREPVDLQICAENAVDASAARIAARSLHVTTALQPAIVHGEPVLLERMVANMVDNAIRYNEDGGSIEITTTSDDSEATLRVTNSGSVVPAARVGEIFEPFQRLNGRASGDGVGLGLSIVDAVTRAHSGTVAAVANAAGGLDVTIRLPVASGEEPAD
jgi:signal transduction histidine kinase